MADKSSVCTICDERHIYRQSTDWRVQCEQALCSECKEFHAISKSSRNYATMPIRDYQTLAPSISSFSRYCSEHEEKYCMFCQTHDKLLCLQCIEQHSECKNVMQKCEEIRGLPRSRAVFDCLEKSPCDLTLIKQKDKQAQLVDVQSTSIQDIKLNLTQTITTNISQTYGCDILPDGKLVFCDYYGKRVVATDTDGKQLFDVPVQNNACDVTCISDKTVAVTTGYIQLYGINIIDISSRKILKFIGRYNYCHGITSVNGSLVYCVYGKGIEMMDVNGENTTTIVRCDLPELSFIASYNDKLYYTNQSINTVTCCDMKGNTIWSFKDETVIRYPYGISVDNDGRVYVVSNGCESVVVLSAVGKQSRRILSREDGLIDPVAMHYDTSRKQLLVANYNTTGFLFGVQS